MINMAPDARLLLTRASREITFACRGRPVADIAKECGIGEQRLDAILGAFVRVGFWNYAVTPRAGFVTRAGIAFLQERTQALAA